MQLVGCRFRLLCVFISYTHADVQRRSPRELFEEPYRICMACVCIWTFRCSSSSLYKQLGCFVYPLSSLSAVCLCIRAWHGKGALHSVFVSLFHFNFLFINFFFLKFYCVVNYVVAGSGFSPLCKSSLVGAPACNVSPCSGGMSLSLCFSCLVLILRCSYSTFMPSLAVDTCI